MVADLVIDRDVRNWVLIPLTLSVFLLLLLRQYISILLLSGKSSDQAAQKDEILQKAILARSSVLRSNFAYLTPSGFRQRLAFLVAPDTGALRQKMEKKDMTEAMMTNPDMAMGMMKQQLSGLGPQLALGAFVNFFFRGFILGKLPFSLSPKFRGMLQSGIDLPSLDVSYLSSLSYYMLLLFGSRGIMVLFFQDAAVNDAAMMAQMQAQSQMSLMNQASMDPQKAFTDELRAVEVVHYQWRLEGAEERAIKVLKRATTGR